MTFDIINDNTISAVNPVNAKQTIVLDAGMGNWSLFFEPLAQELRKFAKVCLVNRDGYLDSSRPTQRNTEDTAHQLKYTLEQNQINEQVILAGHSLGGLHVRMFQHLFPKKVKGVILLDSAHPRMLEVLPEIKSNLEKQISLVNMLKLLARTGLLRLAKRNIPTFGLPSSLHSKYYKVTTKAKYYNTYQKEMKGFESALASCQPLGNLGYLPLLIISSIYGLNNRIDEKSNSEKQEDNVWLDLQKDLTRLSSNSTFVESRGDHFLHLTDTAFIANTIQKFIKQHFTPPNI